MDFKNIDLTVFKKLVDPKSTGDLNAFLENLPQNAGQTVLIAAGIAWAMAAALGLYTTIQVQALTEFRTELQELDALKPNVPTIKEVAVPPAEVKKFAEELSAIYRGLKINARGSTLFISAATTARFTEFREILGHVQVGGADWRLAVDKLCVGRECKQEKLGVALKVSKVSVENPT